MSVLRALAPHAHRYILRVWAAGKCSALSGQKLHDLSGEELEDFDNGEKWFIVTEFLAGMDLYERVTTGPPVAEPVAARWFYEMLQALKVIQTQFAFWTRLMTFDTSSGVPCSQLRSSGAEGIEFRSHIDR